jgi:hypothetical protein
MNLYDFFDDKNLEIMKNFFITMFSMLMSFGRYSSSIGMRSFPSSDFRQYHMKKFQKPPTKPDEFSELLVRPEECLRI